MNSSQKMQRSTPRLTKVKDSVTNGSPDSAGSDESVTDSPVAATATDDLHVEQAADCWLFVRWQLSPRTLERAISAMGRSSHRAQRVLRLLRVEQDDAGPRSVEFVSDQPIPEDATEWFLHLPTATGSWSVEVGFVFGKQKFFSLLHSVPLTLSRQHPQHPPENDGLESSSLASMTDSGSPPPLSLQSTLKLVGRTAAKAHVTIDDVSVPVESRSGTFHWEMSLANGRRVLPVIVADQGRLQRALLAIDLNLNILAPEIDEDD